MNGPYQWIATPDGKCAIRGPWGVFALNNEQLADAICGLLNQAHLAAGGDAQERFVAQRSAEAERMQELERERDQLKRTVEQLTATLEAQRCTQ